MAAVQVLDSNALLRLLRDEPGAGTVAAILEKAGLRDEPVHMTEVNYAEVQYIVRRRDGDAAWGKIALAQAEFYYDSRGSWDSLKEDARVATSSSPPAKQVFTQVPQPRISTLE